MMRAIKAPLLSSINQISSTLKEFKLKITKNKTIYLCFKYIQKVQRLFQW